MKERPILFSAPMVRAILEGRKTQTRRAFNERTMKLMRDASSLGEVSWFMNEGCLAGNDLPYIQQFSPYGRRGERLWVRETFGIGYDDGAGGYSALPWTGADEQRDGKVFYRADFDEKPDEPRRPWRPSIYMPRWASRILLEVTAVRVERLQDISEADVQAEGIQEIVGAGVDHDGTPRDAYRALWESINGAGSWAANPWVWVIEFKEAA